MIPWVQTSTIRRGLVGFPGENPRLFLVDVPVGPVGESDDAFQRPGVVALFVIHRNLCGGFGELTEERLVLERFPEASIVEPLNESRATAGDVHHLADEVGIQPGDEVIEIEIDVIGRGVQLGGEVIAQVVRVQVLGVRGSHDIGAAAFGHLFFRPRSKSRGRRCPRVSCNRRR